MVYCRAFTTKIVYLVETFSAALATSEAEVHLSWSEDVFLC